MVGSARPAAHPALRQVWSGAGVWGGGGAAPPARRHYGRPPGHQTPPLRSVHVSIVEQSSLNEHDAEIKLRTDTAGNDQRNNA